MRFTSWARLACATSSASSVSTISRSSTPTAAVRRCSLWMKVLRVSSASARPTMRLPSVSGAISSLTARHDPMSLHSKLAGTIATRCERSITA